MSRSERDRALYVVIGQATHAARHTADDTQAAFAREPGLFPASVARAEAGRQRFTVEALYRDADALGIDPKKLLS